MRGQYTLYCHVNKANGKKYVGITSKKPQERWGRGSGYAGQRFGSAIKKYGWDGFDHIILKVGMTKVDAEKEEKRLISAWKSNNVAFGYNVAEGGNLSAPGFAKIALRIKKENKTIRPVINLETLEVFDSCEEAAEATGTSRAAIYHVLAGRNKRAGGCRWQYLDAKPPKTPANQVVDTRPVICVDTGERFESVKDAAEFAGVSPPGVIEVCSRKRLTAGGYRFCYEDSMESFVPPKRRKIGKPIQNVETGEVFGSVKEAAEHYGLNPPNISAALSRPQRTVGGFHWIVASDTYTCPGGKKTPVINLDTGELFESINDAAQKHNISRRCIGRACSGERPKAAGYRWAFAKERES